MIDVSKFARSIRFAWHGIVLLARQEQSFRIQLLAAAAVAVLAAWLGLSRAEIALLSVVISSVLVLELLNSAVERLVDLFKPRIHQYAEEVKDIMAGAVFVSSIGAAVVGVIVFYPRVTELLK
jgi:diacylglycerol kinase